MTGPTEPTGVQTPRAAMADEVTADIVKAYLLANPDFVMDDQDLIAALAAPVARNGNNVLDLQQVMISRLQKQVHQLRDIQAELVDAASINALNRDRVHRAALSLLDAGSFEELIAHITEPDRLAEILDIDAVALAIESKEDVHGLGVRGLHILEAGSVDRLLGSGNSSVLYANTEGDPQLFGDRASRIQSQAAVRLEFSASTLPAVIILGSVHPQQFHPSQAADLLEFLGRIVERGVQRWLDLPKHP